VTRPNPALWLYHQFGGRLPTRYRDWVLHDAICRTWLARKLLRVFVQSAPVFGLLVVLGLAKYGFPAGTGPRCGAGPRRTLARPSGTGPAGDKNPPNETITRPFSWISLDLMHVARPILQPARGKTSPYSRR
jgi:Family of unknown function (DUF5313)